MATIEGNMPCKTTNISPSIRANYKIQASLLQKDITELKRRVLHAKLRLESEIKAIENLSNTVKKLRVELGTKKLSSMSIRPQTLALLKHANQCRSSRENFRMNVMKNTARTSASVTTPRAKPLQ
ncbi:UNVERIFIED_CONTAM: hypothetical protein PYX00_002665 [Menopon gallinae]|uniref:Spermatogenesis-associated protein 1 C-terminal domain-containing protein n=1 Tax=Menopon gallinae TaxID=328185 RepID=A0AAW2HWZ8_9NEOP